MKRQALSLALEENKDFDWKAYENTKITSERNKELKENSKNCQDSLDLIKNNGLEIEDFAQGEWNWSFSKK